MRDKRYSATGIDFRSVALKFDDGRPNGWVGGPRWKRFAGPKTKRKETGTERNFVFGKSAGVNVEFRSRRVSEIDVPGPPPPVGTTTTTTTTGSDGRGSTRILNFMAVSRRPLCSRNLIYGPSVRSSSPENPAETRVPPPLPPAHRSYALINVRRSSRAKFYI